MRLFVALPLPADRREAIAAELDRVRGRPAAASALRWTRPEGWHVTLAFLGQVQDAQPARVAVSQAATSAAAFEVATTSVGRFGDRVLWLGIVSDPPRALTELAARVRGALADHGIDIEEDRFRAHVTLARGGRRGSRVEPTLVEELRIPTQRWRSSHLELWRSVLGRGPARYETVASFPLTG